MSTDPAERRQRGWARRRVAEWLEAQIAGGQLVPGQQVPPEPELCTRLGVGRSSVREAVQRLVAAGVLEIRAGTGTFVRGVGVAAVLAPADLAQRLATSGVLDVLELNLILEAGIVELAAKRATPEDLLGVERAIDAGREAIGAPEAFADSIEQFRLALAAASHNAALVQMAAALNVLLRQRRVATAAGFSPGAAERSLQRRQEVLEAMRAGQLAAAQAAASTLTEETRDTVIQEAQAIIRQAHDQARADRRFAATTAARLRAVRSGQSS